MKIKRKDIITNRKYRTVIDNYLHTRLKKTMQKPTLSITLFQTWVQLMWALNITFIDVYGTYTIECGVLTQTLASYIITILQSRKRHCSNHRQ
jgi:hypothetical protein